VNSVCLFQISQPLSPNHGSQARGAEPFIWFRWLAAITHEQPGPSRTLKAGQPIIRRENGVPIFTDRGTATV